MRYLTIISKFPRAFCKYYNTAQTIKNGTLQPTNYFIKEPEINFLARSYVWLLKSFPFRECRQSIVITFLAIRMVIKFFLYCPVLQWYRVKLTINKNEKLSYYHQPLPRFENTHAWKFYHCSDTLIKTSSSKQSCSPELNHRSMLIFKNLKT